MKDAVCALIAVLLFLAVIIVRNECRAHDMYHEWKVPGSTTSCCNDQDCAPRRARASIDGGWEVWDGEEWLPVLPQRVLDMKSPDGRSHACILQKHVLCFVPGEIRS